MNSMKMLVILIQILQIPSTTASVEFFRHGKEHGDTVIVDINTGISHLTVGNSDDGIKMIDTPNFPFYKRKMTYKIQISTNGYVVLGDHKIFNSPQPMDFPINYENYTIPIIAIFWTDVKYKENSTLSYQLHRSKKVLEEIRTRVLQRYPEEIFNPSYGLVVTWFNVYHAASQVKDHYSFQLILASNGVSSYTMFAYERLPPNALATVGFQDRLDIYRHKRSLEPEVANDLMSSSNAQHNGFYLYRVFQPIMSCKDKSDGTHPHPSECDKYLSCYNGQLIEIKQCNNSKHYHPEYKSCVSPDEYPCHPATTLSPFTTTQSTTEMKTTPPMTTTPKVKVNLRLPRLVLSNEIIEKARWHLGRCKITENIERDLRGRFKSELTARENRIKRAKADVIEKLKKLRNALKELKKAIALLNRLIANEDRFIRANRRSFRRQLKRRTRERETVKSLIPDMEKETELACKDLAHLERLRFCISN